MDLQCKTITISKLVKMFDAGILNLDPIYQRKSVWGFRQRKELLKSIFNGILIPSIILHSKRTSKRKIFDVLDGKQRIETILYFLKKIRLTDINKELFIELHNIDNNHKTRIFCKDIKKKKRDDLSKKIFRKFWNYKFSLIEYKNELKDFYDNKTSDLEIFVKINSTGSSLTQGEIRNAEKYNERIFKLGLLLEKKYKYLFLNIWKVTNQTAVNRYQFNEFILELCTSVKEINITDRRRKLNEILKSNISERDINKLKNDFNKTIKWIKKIFPKDDDIRPTRFKNKSEFYSLFVVLLKLIKENYVTDDKKSNSLAREFLYNFSKELNLLSEKIKNKRITKVESRLFDYLNATRQATDSFQSRKIRDKYLMNLLKGGIFIKKDEKRLFNKNDRDLLWIKLVNSGKKLICKNPQKNLNCKRKLIYDDAQVDHIWAYSKGGPSTLKNAQLLCSSCNKKKGKL